MHCTYLPGSLSLDNSFTRPNIFLHPVSIPHESKWHKQTAPEPVWWGKNNLPKGCRQNYIGMELLLHLSLSSDAHVGHFISHPVMCFWRWCQNGIQNTPIKKFNENNAENKEYTYFLKSSTHVHNIINHCQILMLVDLFTTIPNFQCFFKIAMWLTWVIQFTCVWRGSCDLPMCLKMPPMCLRLAM